MGVYIGQRRTALLRIGPQMRVGRTLEQLLAHLEPRLKQVLHVMSFSHNDITAALCDRVRLRPGSKDSNADNMRAFKSSPGLYFSTAVIVTKLISVPIIIDFSSVSPPILSLYSFLRL